MTNSLPCKRQAWCLDINDNNMTTSWWKNVKFGIAINDCWLVTYEVYYTFLMIFAGEGLVSWTELPVVFLWCNKHLYMVIKEYCNILCESASLSTNWSSLVMQGLDVVSITDASKHGIGRMMVGQNNTVVLMAFWAPLLDSIKCNMTSCDKPNGSIVNSDH